MHERQTHLNHELVFDPKKKICKTCSASNFALVFRIIFSVTRILQHIMVQLNAYSFDFHSPVLLLLYKTDHNGFYFSNFFQEKKILQFYVLKFFGKFHSCFLALSNDNFSQIKHRRNAKYQFAPKKSK